MKTTSDKIEALNKAGKILSRIFFLLSAVGIAASVILIIYIYIAGGPGETTKEILSKYECSPSAIYPLFIAVIIALIGELFLSRKAEKYFSLTLERGTPFTAEGAKSLFLLGIYSIVVPIATYAISFLILYLSPSVSTAHLNFRFHFSLSSSLGVMFIIISLLVKLGSEEKGEEV